MQRDFHHGLLGGCQPIGGDRGPSAADALADDATTGITLIAAVDGDLTSVTGDAADDTVAFYGTAGSRGATVVVSPGGVMERILTTRANQETVLTKGKS